MSLGRGVALTTVMKPQAAQTRRDVARVRWA
jgi:hypothetical protein